MLYAVPQHASDSLKLVKTVLQLIASEQDVSQHLRARVYEVIREASTLTVEGDLFHMQVPNHRESISLAVEMQHTQALATVLTGVTSEDMLQPVVAKSVLEYIRC